MIKRATTILAVIGLAAAAGLAWWLQNRPSATADATRAAAESPAAGGAAPAAPRRVRWGVPRGAVGRR
jgi:hypothetical protein